MYLVQVIIIWLTLINWATCVLELLGKKLLNAFYHWVRVLVRGGSPVTDSVGKAKCLQLKLRRGKKNQIMFIFHLLPAAGLPESKARRKDFLVPWRMCQSEISPDSTRQKLSPTALPSSANKGRDWLTIGGRVHFSRCTHQSGRITKILSISC